MILLSFIKFSIVRFAGGFVCTTFFVSYSPEYYLKSCTSIPKTSKSSQSSLKLSSYYSFSISVLLNLWLLINYNSTHLLLEKSAQKQEKICFLREFDNIWSTPHSQILFSKLVNYRKKQVIETNKCWNSILPLIPNDWSGRHFWGLPTGYEVWRVIIRNEEICRRLISMVIILRS